MAYMKISLQFHQLKAKTGHIASEMGLALQLSFWHRWPFYMT